MGFVDVAVAIVIGLVAVTNGHMEMKSPPPFRSKYNPYTGSDIDYSMTSPLSASGSDYPCKGYQKLLGGPEGKSVVTWTSGGSYNFTITGSANHGGGSCQASLSYDNGHSWKVVRSYIGGCPPPQDSNWDFTVPSDAPAGDAMFAWTWFNNIGNREMYMNCASVTIVNGKKRSSSAPFAGRPAAFVANIGNNVCTYEGKDVEFPHPGPDVDRNSESTSPPGQGTCSGPPPASPPASPPTTDPGMLPAPPPQVVAPQLPVTSSVGEFFVISTIPKVVDHTSVTSVDQPAAPTRSDSCPVSMPVGSTCVTEGQWNCAPDGKHFQRCASGVWSVSIPMAAGTSCQPGTSDSFIILN
ncbi:hypothetical protein GGI35DRAFT_472791 [Trichoderma velutinum]